MLKAESIDQAALQTLIRKNAAAGVDLDQLGYELASETAGVNSGGLDNLWEKVKGEFRILICTDDAKYADLRKQASALNSNYTTTIVAAIAAAIAVTLGTTAALLMPLISLLLLALARVGKNAICSLEWGA